MLLKCTGAMTVLLIITDRSLTVYVDKLKRVYQTPPTTWLSLPNCKHIKLAMTNEKGTRHTREPDELIEHRVKGEVEPLMASKVPVDMDSIFDEGTFGSVHRPLVILVEGAFGSGKTRLAYHYCQKWAQGNLAMFDLVALVYLRHPAVHSAGMNLDLDKLLLLASIGEKGIDDDILRHVVQLIEKGLKFLLVLDGWDEGPACLRAPPDLQCPPDNSFLGNLLRSVSSNTTILITSRPDSSVDLHNSPNVKRVEILGFTKKSIHEYFREALSTQLSSTILEDECRKLKDHLANYPAIESSCYIPLNAAILTILYLQRNRTLPTTHFEMFHELLLCCIAREVNNRLPRHNLGAISSLDALPHDLKKQLEHISILAYEGVMKNKIVFLQEELLSLLHVGIQDEIFDFLSPASAPAQQDLPAMGVLQKVQWARTGSKTIAYNFVHLSIQETLAAYCISQMESDEQVKVFQTLLDNPRFAAVLQFYAGFTKLTNQGVRDVITSSNFFGRDKSSNLLLLSYIRCFFEAQIRDQLLYEKISQRLNGILDFKITLSPLDCMSIGYFLAFVRINKYVFFTNSCGINGQSLSLMMGELTKHAKACPLLEVESLKFDFNKIGDSGIAVIATVLQTNTTIRELRVDNCGISDEGAEILASALAVNKSVEKLDISNNEISDNGIAHLVTALQTVRMGSLRVSENYMITDEGALSLVAALTGHRSDSMSSLILSLSSAHPDSTLKKIGEFFNSNMLYQLVLEIKPPEATQASDETAIEWLRCLELGVRELLLLPLKDPSYHHLQVHLDFESKMAIRDRCKVKYKQMIGSLWETVTAVERARKRKGLHFVYIQVFDKEYDHSEFESLLV